MSPLQFPGTQRRGFPFPQRRQQATRRQPGQGRSVFGRGAGGGLKIRLLMALGLAAFALISYYSKAGDVNEVTGETERVAMTEEAQEIKLGLQAAPQMVGQHGGQTRNQEAQLRVNRIGNRLLVGLERNLNEYNRQHPEAKRRNPYLNSFRFTLLTDPRTVNAFALPGGQVFITHALYDQLETEGQLAGVLGHEIGHVIMRHGNKRMAKQGLYQGLAGAMGVLGGGGQGGQMGQMVASALSMKYGRDHELESDDWGVRLCKMADYDPRAMKGVMKILEKAGGGGKTPEFMSTHPKPANRVEYIEQAIKKYYPNGVPEGLPP